MPFDETVVASEIGSYKPAHRHWEEFFARTGAPQEGHVHVAASRFHDIAPARDLGLRTVWINRLGERPDAAARSRAARPRPPAGRARRARPAMNVRPPRRNDLDAVLALMRAHDTAAWGGCDWTRAGLEEHWAGLDLERDAWVVELGGRLAGYVDFEALPQGRLFADGYVDPAARGRGIGSALADTVEARAAHEPGGAFLHYAALEGGSAPSSSAAATGTPGTSGGW